MTVYYETVYLWKKSSYAFSQPEATNQEPDLSFVNDPCVQAAHTLTDLCCAAAPSPQSILLWILTFHASGAR